MCYNKCVKILNDRRYLTMKMDKLKSYLKETVVTEEEIHEIVDRLANKLNEEYVDKKEPIVVVGLLKGGLLFTCEVFKKLNFPCSIDFFWATSYVGSASTHKLDIRKDLDEDVEGKHIIVLNDLVSTATSMKVITEKLKESNPASVRVFTLLSRKNSRKYDFTPDFVGKEVGDEFLVGYGMDYNDLFRNLPYIAMLDDRFYK